MNRLHRDLKSGNIMLTKSGAKLLACGLAKAALPLALGATTAVTGTTPVTQHGTIVGTFQYLSPEHVEGKDVDTRSDIFSLGAVLYEMLTGRPSRARNYDSEQQAWGSGNLLDRCTS
jgi:serine/threonine protein kinase